MQAALDLQGRLTVLDLRPGDTFDFEVVAVALCGISVLGRA